MKVGEQKDKLSAEKPDNSALLHRCSGPLNPPFLLLQTYQTCLAVDYILCVGGCQPKILDHLKKSIEAFYGDDAQKSDSYGRIISKRHFAYVFFFIRIKLFMDIGFQNGDCNKPIQP